MIVIVDYGMGNIGSIGNMLKKIGEKVIVSSDVDVIQDAKKTHFAGCWSI